MMSIGLFLGMSLLLMGMLIGVQFLKKIDFKTEIALFLFGMLLSVPFLIVEYLAFDLKYYIMILAFIAIELMILKFEHKIKPIHDLMHHNVKHLRMLSFFIIGIGFTYSEIGFTIFHSHQSAGELMHVLPVKTLYAVFIHTVLTTAASLNGIGQILAHDIFETVFRFVAYYLRIAIISVSHFLYVFFSEHAMVYFLIPFLLINVFFFFRYKHYLDHKTINI